MAGVEKHPERGMGVPSVFSLAHRVPCPCDLTYVLQGAGGVITDWRGNELRWRPPAEAAQAGSNEAFRADWPGEVLAAGDERLHKQALAKLAF
jgi:hypothetical protein